MVEAVGAELTGGDNLGPLTEVQTEISERNIGALVLLSQNVNDSALSMQDCQPPWKNGLLWVDTE
jgi:hypothetical protein